MLTALEVRSPQGALLKLPFAGVVSGYIVEKIEGLDPVKATLVSSGYASLDGAYYQSSRREPRDIKITLALEPNYATESVEDLRKRLYEYFMPKSEARLRFRGEDGESYDIAGRVESLETPLFVKEPIVDISLRCFDPDFKDPTPSVWTGNTVNNTNNTAFTYDGTVETGFVIDMTIPGDLSQFTIYHTPPDGTLRSLEFNQPLVVNDKISISTIVGSKSAIRTRAAVATPILYGVTPQSKWLELQPGVNLIRVTAAGVSIPYTITFTKRYGGL